MIRQSHWALAVLGVGGFLLLTFAPLDMLFFGAETDVETDPITLHLLNFEISFQILEWAGLLFLFLIVGETIWDFVAKTRRKPSETAANYLIAIGNLIVEKTVFGLIFVIGLFAVQKLSVTQIPITWWSWIAVILVADFTYYWMHRFEHEVRLLWAYHSVHHSSPEFNLTTALRLSWIEGAFEWVFFVPMIVMGFDAGQTLIAIATVVSYQTWIHTQKIGKLGWLDKVLNTPSVHRVHHGSNPRYLDKNYGGILIVWDRIFGTYQAEEEPVVFGITEPVNSINPLKVNFHEYRLILRDFFMARTFWQGIGYMVRRPGWSPKLAEKDEKDP